MLTAQPVLQIKDAANRTITRDSTTQITAALEGTDTETDGTLGGITQITATNGIATFTNLALTGAVARRTRLNSQPTSTPSVTSNWLTLDTTVITIQSVSVAPGAHGIDDAVLVTLTAANAETGLTLNPATFNGRDLSDVKDKGDGTYTATYTVQAGDKDVADGGTVITNLAFTDAAGNTGLALTQLTLEGTSIDTTAPTVAITAPLPDEKVSADEAKNFTVSGTTTGVQAGQNVTLTLTDGVNPVVTRTAAVEQDGVWQVTGIDLSGLSDGILTLSATVADAAGNAAGPISVKFTLDKTAPRVASVLVQAGAHGIDDAVQVTITAANGEVGLVLSPKAFNGQTLGDVTDIGGGRYTATYTVQADDNIAQGDAVVTNFVFTDAAGNTGPAFTQFTLEGASIDATAPVVTVSHTELSLREGETGQIYTLSLNGRPPQAAVTIEVQASGTVRVAWP